MLRPRQDDLDEGRNVRRRTDANGERAAEIRSTGFATAGGNNLLLDHGNANRPAAWIHQWIGVLPRSLRGIGLSLEQRLDNQHRAEEEAEETRNIIDPVAAQIRRNRLLAAHQAARIHDAHADYSDGNRRLAELNARINNEIGIDYSGIDIVLGNIEPLEEDEIDSFHQIPEDYYRIPGHLLLHRKFARLLPSFHVPCMVYRREQTARPLKPREKPTTVAAANTTPAATTSMASSMDADPGPVASPDGGVAAFDPEAVYEAFRRHQEQKKQERLANAAAFDPQAVYEAFFFPEKKKQERHANAASNSTDNNNNTNAASTSASASSTPLPPPTGFPYERSTMESSTDPSDCAKLLDWSKMVRDEWNTYLLLKEIISKNDVDSESIAAIKALNGPNLRYHICNNQPVTVIIVCSFAPFGIYEGSPFYKFMELFFYGVSYLVIDLCPIVAPGGVNILGQRNITYKILGETIHNKIMTTLERILRQIRDNNRAIIVGCGAASKSGNLLDIIGNYHAHHPCCIYAGYGNINNDYLSLGFGAKLQMKLFGSTNQHEIEKWLHSIKWEIMSTNRAYTQDTENIATKIEQSKAWNLVGIYIDNKFKPVKIALWDYDSTKKLLRYIIAKMIANEVEGKKYIDWSGWEDYCDSSFTELQAQEKMNNMLTQFYGRNTPRFRSRELFQSLLDNMTPF